jgi:predicted HTH domain antitoxin
MAVTIQLPENLERELRSQVPDLDEATREQFIIANYQLGRLGTGDIALVLGLETRQDAEQWLDRRGVRANYDLNSLEADRRAMADVRKSEDR